MSPFRNTIHLSISFLAELSECPTCACMPDLTKQGQLHRAKNWIQGMRIVMFQFLCLQANELFDFFYRLEISTGRDRTRTNGKLESLITPFD